MSNERFKAQVAATFLARSQSSALLTDYVSYLGVFVRTDSPPPVMELLRIEFVLPPESEKVILHGMVTQLVAPQTKHAVPGAEVTFFAKAGESGRIWDKFIQYVRTKYPESGARPVMLAEGATDQIRRAHPRQVPASPLTIVSADHGDSLTLGDISSGGMFLKTQKNFAIGSDLRVTLVDPRGTAKFPLDCVVRRRTFGSDGGIGLEFRNMTDSTRVALTEFLRLAGPKEGVQAQCQEVLAPYAPRMMNTLPGPRYSGGPGSMAPAEDSWTSLDEGWPSA